MYSDEIDMGATSFLKHFHYVVLILISTGSIEDG